MGPISAYSLLFQLLIILLSIWQTRMSILKKWNWAFWAGVFFSFLFTLVAYEGIGSNPIIALLFTAYWTFLLTFTQPKQVAPKMNEAYIYLYTLYFWYVLGSDIYQNPNNLLLYGFAAIAMYPSLLILRACFSPKVLESNQKVVLFFWFLVCVIFIYLNEVFVKNLFPYMAVHKYSFVGFTYTLISAVQVYFMAIIISFALISNPIAHLDRDGRSFATRWKEAKRDSKKIIETALQQYINFQLSKLQWLYLTLGSFFIFYLDAIYEAHLYTLLLYTLVMPLVYFYFKWSPPDNTEFIEE